MNIEAPEPYENSLTQTESGCNGETLGVKPSWYAVQVKRHDERRVVRHLTRKEIPSFLPFIEVVRRYRTRRVTRIEPLFPGYLFVQMDPVDLNPSCWHTVRWTPGVRLILGTEDTPVPLPDSVIEAIQTRVKELGFVRPGVGFAAGSRVRIRYGPLAGLEAVFDRQMSRAGRVRVLLELLGQQRSVEVELVDLESA